MTEKKHRPTMKDVANRAEVTIGTVSHVLNHTAPISSKTTKRVLEAIKELDYVPNSFARNIRSKKNRQIGLMIPNLNNNFYSRLTSHFVDMASQNKYVVHIMGYEYSLQKEMEEMRSLMEYNVGTIVIVNGFGDEKAIRELVNRGIFVILADRRAEIPDVSCVEYENRSTYCQLVGMLRDKGYRSIGFVCEPLHLINLRDRYEGYLMGLEKYGYEFREDFVYTSERLYLDYLKNGYLFMKDLLAAKKKEELPEAFLFTSDLLAIGAMRAIREKGYEIPGDFGIVGCDNLDVADYVQPGLSSVEQNKEPICEKLWEMILTHEKGGKTGNIVLPQRIVLRESF